MRIKSLLGLLKRRGVFFCILSLLTSCLFVLKVDSVYAGSEQCKSDPNKPLCYGTLDIHQWMCNYCSSTKYVCAGDGKTCTIPGSDPNCVPPYGGGGPCYEVCADPLGPLTWCSDENLHVGCNTSPGNCQYDGTVKKCQSKYNSCTESDDTEFHGCCGPGIGQPTSTPAPTNTPEPPGPPPPTNTPPVGCEVAICTETPGNCGAPLCSSDERAYIKTCDLPQCDSVRCEYDSTCIVPPSVSCEISINPISISSVGSTVTSTVSIIEEIGGSITRVLFSVDPSAVPPNVASITSTNPDTNRLDGFTVDLQGEKLGVTTYHAEAVMNDVNSTRCYTGANVSVASLAWFQTMGGNVVSKGGVTSLIPASAYNLNFIKDPAGLLIYSFASPPNLGSGFSGGALVNTSISSKPLASFDLFYNTKLPSDVKSGLTTISSNSINTSDLATCNLLRGYKVCYYDGTTLGDLTLNNDYVMADGDRVVLFVNNAKLIIKGKINPATQGKSSLLVISSGRVIAGINYGIEVDPNIGSAFVDDVPDLEGVFYTDGMFTTGHTASGMDFNLHIRGSVVANNFLLNRNLGNLGAEKNNLYPAEFFQYGPEQVMAFPPFLRTRPVSWSQGTP